MRDTLAAVFVGLALLSAPALLISGTFDVPDAIGALLAAGLAGQIVGRRLFARLAGDGHENVVLVVLAIAALTALAASAV